MTGYFVRCCRDNGHWESVDVAELTDTELTRFFNTANVDHDAALNWTKALAVWIRDNVTQQPAIVDKDSGSGTGTGR